MLLHSLDSFKMLKNICMQVFFVARLSPCCTIVVFSLGPGSLPGYRRRGDFDDGASDISSTSGFSAYGYRSGKALKNGQKMFDMDI